MTQRAQIVETALTLVRAQPSGLQRYQLRDGVVAQHPEMIPTVVYQELDGLPARSNGEVVALGEGRLVHVSWLAQPTADYVELAERARALMESVPESPPLGSVNPSRTTTTREVILRDPVVRAWVLRAAAGTCELCRQPAPFTGADGIPFLEVHHVRPLADGGSDTVSNAVALCPNCHRRCHHDAQPEQVRQRLFDSIPRLVPE